MLATSEKRVRKVKLKNIGLIGLEKELAEFEKKYRMSTDEFLKKIERGELTECNDFIDWLGAAEQYQQIKQGQYVDI